MDPQKKRILELVEKHADALAEHVDSVRIFVTARNEEDNDAWIAYSEGRGNIYAQQGQISEWLQRQHERVRIDENSKDDDEPLTGGPNEECGGE